MQGNTGLNRSYIPFNNVGLEIQTKRAVALFS